jgi:hypothetical protein
MKLQRILVLGLASLTASFSTSLSRANDTFPGDASSRSVARVSILTGDVSVRRSASGEYVAGALNAPVVAGDSIATGPSGRAEVQFNAANVLRIGHDSEIRVTDLEPGRIGMQIARGTLTYSVLRDSGAQVEISTPTVSVRPLNRGSVRVSVLDDGQTEVTARSGQVEIYTPRGVETVTVGQTLIARGSASDPEFQIVAAIQRDGWDEWNDSRDRALLSSPGYQYVSQDISGAEDLDRYGQWINDPSYGEVWSPRVAADWAPYRDGRWVSDDYYGWTWLGYEPWGWAPYHYGNWFYGSYGWCWYPGPRYAYSYWRPAVVGFFGFGGGSGSFGFGFGNVGWVPLAPFETYRPWYGRGRSFNIANNVNIYGSFRNARYNGLTGIDARNFSGGRYGSNFAVSRSQLSQAGMVQGGLPFRASGASQRFTDRQTSYVPRGNSFSRPFASRNAFQGSSALSRGSAQPLPGNRDPGWSRFGGNRGVTTQPYSRGSAGLQPSPGNRDSGWSRFGGNRGVTAQPYSRGSAGLQASPGNRDSGWSRFGGDRGVTTQPHSRGSAGLQASPGNRDSGWSRFSGNRGVTAPQYSRGSAGLQASPQNRDSGWNRFGGNRGVTTPQYSRGSAGFQPYSGNRDSGGNRFGGARGGGVTAPLQQSARVPRGFESRPPNRDFSGSRFGGNRSVPMPAPQVGRGSAGFESRPSHQDFGGSRFGGNRGGFATPPQSARSGGSPFDSPSRGSMPMAAAPHLSPPISRSAPGPSANNFNRGMSNAPRPSSPPGGGHNNDPGSHRGRHDR